jgi:hypothetical protein
MRGGNLVFILCAAGMRRIVHAAHCNSLTQYRAVM